MHSHGPNTLQWSSLLVTVHLPWFGVDSFQYPPLPPPTQACWGLPSEKGVTKTRLCPWPNPRQVPPSGFQLGPVCGHVLKSPILARVLRRSQFSQNPSPAISEHQHLTDIWWDSSHPTTSQVIADHLGLPLSRILLGSFSPNPCPYPWCFLLIIFHPLIPTRLLGYKFPTVLVFRVEHNLSPRCKTPLQWS